MRIKFKTGITFIFLAVGGGAALMALFYFTPSDPGRYGTLSAPEVLGESTERFRMPGSEVLLGTAAGSGAKREDAVFLSENTSLKRNVVRIVRNQAELVFEQAVSIKFQEVSFDTRASRFVVADGENNKLWLVADGDGYRLVPGL